MSQNVTLRSKSRGEFYLKQTPTVVTLAISKCSSDEERCTKYTNWLKSNIELYSDVYADVTKSRDYYEHVANLYKFLFLNNDCVWEYG